MSFAISFHKFISIQVEDDSQLPLAGLEFRPTAATRVKLQDHRLLFRRGEGGFELFYQTNPLADDSLVGPITKRTRFTFGISLAEKTFFQNQQPDLTRETGRHLYFDNLSNFGAVLQVSGSFLSDEDKVTVYDAITLHSQTLTLRAEVDGGRPSKFIAKPRVGGGLVREFPIESSSGLATIDLSKDPTGPYTVETEAGGFSKRTIYVDGELAAAGVLGVLDLHWESRQDTVGADGLSYRLCFNRR